jgi:hypothetical protein
MVPIPEQNQYPLHGKVDALTGVGTVANEVAQAVNILNPLPFAIRDDPGRT